MNVGAAFRELLLESFLVAGELGGISVGDRLVGVSGVVSGCTDGAAVRDCGGACLVGVADDVGTVVGSGYGGDGADGSSAGAGGCLVEVNAIAADAGAVIALAAVPVSASTLAAVVALAVVIALVATVLGVAIVPAGVLAVSVLS